MWSWQDTGWFGWRVKTLTSLGVTAGASVYTGYRQILPFGSQYWQKLDLTANYYNPLLYPNPGTNGTALVTNAYRPYSSGSTELYYTNDILKTFGSLSKDGDGNVVRSQSTPFDHKLTYPDGRTFDLHNVYAISYSANGQWMYANVSDTAQLRIKTSDFSVFSFAPGQDNYYALYSATSNSGNTVATYSYDHGLRLYDLTRCEAEKPDYGSRDCVSRDITDLLKNEFAKTLSDPSSLVAVYVSEIKFLTESKIRLLVQYQIGTEYKAAFVTLETATSEQPTRYLALGDSFSSGEGALSYRGVTDLYVDESNYNLCHQSSLSYPYLLNKSLSPDWFGDVACSGARQKDIYVESKDPDRDYIRLDPQARVEGLSSSGLENIKDKLMPGYIPQMSFMQEYSPSVATISIGGNDIGFGDIVTACIVNKFFRNMQSCSADRFDREQVANTVDAQIPKLTATFKTIKQNLTGDQKLYVIGYPRIVNTTNLLCPLNTPMDQNEREFADNLVRYLNEALRIAAGNAGVRFIDVSSAFVDSDHDYRLCGNDEQKAVNGLMTESSSKRKPNELAAHESFHPNQLGHGLLAKQIRLLTNDFSLAMPDSVLTSSVPGSQFRTALVGDTVITNLNQGVNYITDSIPNLVIDAGTQTLSTIANAPGTIAQTISATIELHSSPITIGQATVSTDNTITGNVLIPDTVSPGYHQLHILYTDSTGQEYDLYKYVLVVASADDYDGDGAKNDAEACVIGDGSGVDSDKDGIDDACDGEYVAAAENADNTESASEKSFGTATSGDNTRAVSGESRDELGVLRGEDRAVFMTQTDELNIANTLQKMATSSMSDSSKVSKKVSPVSVFWPVVAGLMLVGVILLAIVCRIVVVKKSEKR